MKLRTILLIILAIFFAGCESVPPREGGGGSVVLPGGEIEMKAPQDPASPSSQKVTTTNILDVPLPPGAVVTFSNNVYRIELPSIPDHYATYNPRLRQVRFYKVEQEVGAAQRDLSKIIAEKAKATRPIVWTGIALIILGLIQVHPVVFAFFGSSRSFQFFCFLIGTILAFSPSLVIGNEKLIIFIAVGFIAIWWLARRYGEKDGLLRAQGIHPNMNQERNYEHKGSNS